MKKAIELYNKGDSSYFYFGSYDIMLNEFGNIVVQVDDDDYQGDSRILYKDGNRFGYLQFGWGSCSGCDALQGCSNIEEVQDLMDDLHSRIQWFDSKEDAMAFFIHHDWEGDYSWHMNEQKKFVSDVIEYLNKE